MSEMKTIEFRNDFHDTSARVRATAVGLNNAPYTVWSVTARQMREAARKLCGMADCTCGTVRGEQGNPRAAELWEAYQQIQAGAGIGECGKCLVRR